MTDKTGTALPSSATSVSASVSGQNKGTASGVAFTNGAMDESDSPIEVNTDVSAMV